MKPDTTDALLALQQRCKTQGLALTASRSAILSALLEQSDARDAVPLLQAAQTHHAPTSIGTVYRFLRELEQRGLVDAYAQPHGRTRWQLRETTSATATPIGDFHRMLAQLQDFLRLLEQMNIATHSDVPDAKPKNPQPEHDRTLAVLREIARQLGYRLLPGRSYTT